MDVNLRQKEDFHGGTSTATFVGVLVVKTDKDVLNHLLRDILKDATGGGWENDDYGHEDLVIEEYTKVTIGVSSFFPVDWNREDCNTTTYYFLYYPISRIDHDVSNKDSGEPVPPSMENLESLVRPPADHIKGMYDYYYHQYIGQVKA